MIYDKCPHLIYRCPLFVGWHNRYPWSRYRGRHFERDFGPSAVTKLHKNRGFVDRALVDIGRYRPKPIGTDLRYVLGTNLLLGFGARIQEFARIPKLLAELIGLQANVVFHRRIDR